MATDWVYLLIQFGIIAALVTAVHRRATWNERARHNVMMAMAIRELRHVEYDVAKAGFGAIMTAEHYAYHQGRKVPDMVKKMRADLLRDAGPSYE